MARSHRATRSRWWICLGWRTSPIARIIAKPPSERCGRLGSKIMQQAVAVPQMLVGLDYALGPRREVVIAGDAEEFLRHVRERFLPRTITLRAGRAIFSGGREHA